MLVSSISINPTRFEVSDGEPFKWWFFVWLGIVTNIGAIAVFKPFQVCKSCVIVAKTDILTGRSSPESRRILNQYPQLEAEAPAISARCGCSYGAKRSRMEDAERLARVISIGCRMPEMGSYQTSWYEVMSNSISRINLS